MSNYIQIADNKNLVRDSFSKAVLTVDREALSQHRNKKRMMKELLETSSRIVVLEDDIREIKNILYELLKGKD